MIFLLGCYGMIIEKKLIINALVLNELLKVYRKKIHMHLNPWEMTNVWFVFFFASFKIWLLAKHFYSCEKETINNEALIYIIGKYSIEHMYDGCVYLLWFFFLVIIIVMYTKTIFIFTSFNYILVSTIIYIYECVGPCSRNNVYVMCYVLITFLFYLFIISPYTFKW